MKKLLSYSVDALAFVGCAAILYGVAQIHRPSAWILGGAMSLAAAIFTAWSRRT